MGKNQRWWIIGSIVIIIYTALPVLWIISLSFKTGAQLTDGNFFPRDWSWANYKAVLSQDLFTSALRNSIGISLIATTLSVVIATLAAYAIARLNFPGKKVILSTALAIAIFPAVSLIGPMFTIWRSVGLYDTWPGLIIPYMTF